jgi:ADP-ribose pyrophosphatase YjhB (NUDIX family)
LTGGRLVPCAGGIVLDGPIGTRRLLLIRRGRPPAQGAWSVPGGRCLPAEPPAQCCVRELAEETGLAVEVLRHAGRVERDAPDGATYVIDDFVCRVLGGRAQAGDDAIDLLWAARADLARLPLSPGLEDALSAWALLPD